jgi:hypothetical protein
MVVAGTGSRLEHVPVLTIVVYIYITTVKAGTGAGGNGFTAGTRSLHIEDNILMH